MDGPSLRDELQRQIQAGQMQACLLSSRRGANDAMAREKAQDLHRLRQLEQKFLVPFEMIYLGGIAARELVHSLERVRVGMDFGEAVLTERLET